MSALSTHRLRDRNGAVLPNKTTTPPISKNPNPVLKKSSSGKENPRPKSNPRAQLSAQKPKVRPVPRVDNAAATLDGGASADARMRWSTSSAPRGRSPSPSEFIRVFSDIKRERNPRVSVDKFEKEKKGFRDLNGKDNSGFGVNFVKSDGNSSKVRVLGGKSEKDGNFSTEFVKSREIKLRSCSDLDLKDQNCSKFNDKCQKKIDSKILRNGNGVDLGLKGFSEKPLSFGNNVDAPENSKEKGVSEIGIKYPSKLHEKLAFLEGKVKRIASDIKKTKEMLDMNNPDASKVILSDIHDKISGIEKAMNHVVKDSDGKAGASKENENVKKASNDVKIVHNRERKEIEDVKVSVKGLNSEELEARLFPHHKLLRDRTLKVSSGSSQSNNSCIGEANFELKVEEKVLSPIDENPIALEFLASLNEESKVTIRNEQIDLKCCEIQETDGSANSGENDSAHGFNGKQDDELLLTSDETIDEFDDQENIQVTRIGEEIEDTCIYQLNEIGSKASTGGWFVSEGEAVLLAHDDGSCSYYDIANDEEKVVYKPPTGVSPNIWRDCWIIRAPGADGCSGRYVVAASAGNVLDSGFCSWDFYDKDVRALHLEAGTVATSRTILGPLSTNTTYRRNALCTVSVSETQEWWYKPCGPLVISATSSHRSVKIYDIRDGEQIMEWQLQKPVLTMDYSSPVQWRNKGKVVLAEAESISVWDVNSLSPQALLSISLSGRKISALHVNNTDAELGGGIRQRVSSANVEGNDGVFCTPDSINIMDFRHPAGVGIKISKTGVNAQSVFSSGDSVFLGCSNVRSAGKRQPCSQVQQFSLRKQRLFSTYSLPESDAHTHHSAITQVWGNSNIVMGVSGLGLFVFDASGDDRLQSFTGDYGSSTQKVKEVVGPDNMYSPSFDYLASRILLISRDRPALWRHLP